MGTGGWKWTAWFSKVVWLLQRGLWALVALGEAAFPHWSSSCAGALAHGFSCRLCPPHAHWWCWGKLMLGAGSWLNKTMQELSISTNPSAVVPCLIKFVEPQAIHGEKWFLSVIRGRFGCQGVRSQIMKLFFLVAFCYEFLENTLNEVMMHGGEFFRLYKWWQQQLPLAGLRDASTCLQFHRACPSGSPG